jgi:hypothetical protein
MNLRHIALLAALALWVAAPASAQTAAGAPKAAAKPAAKTAKPGAKAADKAPAEAPLPAANDEQKAAAGLAHRGEYACEFDQTVSVMAHAAQAGYLDLQHKTQRWVMKPVLSSTGAIRLEDVKGRMLMIQIANKSMLMDSQIGQRLVDGCVHEKQRQAMADAASRPPGESLLQASPAGSAPK